jgi:choice-of-anchor C domain-containing protein
MMRVTRVTYTFAIGLALAIGSVGSASALPFTNGSFEQGPAFSGSGITLPVGSTAITGWEIFGSDIDVATVWQPSDGLRSLDLNGSHGPGGIRQTFDTLPGAVYRVDFDFSLNPDGPPVPFITMSWNYGNGGGSIGLNSAFLPPPTRANMQWQSTAFIFTAIGDSTTLSFFSTIESQFFGPTLDNVRVQLVAPPVPEPATLSLLAIGLAGVAVRRRRV